MRCPRSRVTVAMRITPYVKAFAIGTVAGLRSVTAPASTLRPTSALLVNGLRLGALAELVIDKLPFTPPRTALPVLAIRVLTGALSADTLARRMRASRPASIAIGAAGALAGTYLGYELRRYLTHERGWPDVPVALAEDVVAVVGGRVANLASAT